MVQLYDEERSLMHEWHGEIPTTGEDFTEAGEALKYFLEFAMAVSTIAKGIDGAQSLAKRVRGLIAWTTKRKTKPLVEASLGERVLALVYHEAYTRGPMTAERLTTLLGVSAERTKAELKRLVTAGLLAKRKPSGFVPPFHRDA
jgi:hypothetical protein